MPEMLTFEEQLEISIKYEFDCRLIKEENARRAKEREKRSKDPDAAFEFRLAEIRRRTEKGIFPDELIDEMITQTLCDPNSYVRRYALLKYGFKQTDLQTFALSARSLADRVKLDDRIHEEEVEKVLQRLKKELKQQQRIIKGYLRFK